MVGLGAVGTLWVLEGARRPGARGGASIYQGDKMKFCMIGAAALMSIAVAGCGNKEETKAAEAPAAEAKPAFRKLDKGETVVSVNGKKLTQGELDVDVEKLMAARNVPAEQKEQAAKMFGENIAQGFVMRTIFMDEVAKKGIKVSDEERKERQAEILKNFPDCKTFEEACAKHPLGKERAMQEFEDGLAIHKLIDQEVMSKIVVDPKKIQEIIQNAVSNNTEAAKKMLDAEAKIKTLKKELDGVKKEELAKKFAELAKANSDCPSKEKGGSLGEFGRGMMVKPFEDVAFSSEELKVSEPVKTQFGWHLIMVEKKIPAVAASGDKAAQPEKVKASHILIKASEPQKAPEAKDVEHQLKHREGNAKMREYIEKLRQAAKIESTVYPSLVPAKPVAPKAIESAPVEVKTGKPVEAKPAEAKPAEAKPAEAKK